MCPYKGTDVTGNKNGSVLVESKGDESFVRGCTVIPIRNNGYLEVLHLGLVHITCMVKWKGKMQVVSALASSEQSTVYFFLKLYSNT